MNEAGYELVVDDRFDRPQLDEDLWLPHHLPQWSSRSQARARYLVGDGLRLRIEEDQPPWCPELDGQVRVSSLQTGVFAGPLGSRIGQHRFNEDAVVREDQPATRLFTPWYGRFEMQARALADPRCMVALWMIGFEDEPERSAEICIAEIFGRNVRADGAGIGMGVHPFGDPAIVDDFATVDVAIDVREPHVYGAEWTPDGVTFRVDGRVVRNVQQSPRYPMQIMLGIYEFPDGGPAGTYPKEFLVDWFRAYRPV
jgi:hypothetical protein